MIGPDRNVKPVLSTVNQYQITCSVQHHGWYRRSRHPKPWQTVGRRPKISWLSWCWRICETSVRFWNPRRIAFWRCSLSVFFEFEWLTFLEFWRETFLETTSEHISSLVGFSNPSFIFFNYIQGCQTYRTLCLWERFFLIFDFILIGQFSSHSISLKKLNVRLIGHFWFERVRHRVFWSK